MRPESYSDFFARGVSMTKRMTDDEFVRYLIERMLKYAGKTYEEAQATPEWFSEWTWTATQEREYRTWWFKQVKKREPRIPRRELERSYHMWSLNYGLKAIQ